MREFDALLRRKQIAEMWTRYNFGIVGAAVHNCAPFGDANRQPLSPLDFVPALKKELEDSERAGASSKVQFDQITPEQQKAYLDALFGARKMLT